MDEASEYTVGLAGEDRALRFMAGLCAGQPQIQVMRHSKEGPMLRAPRVLTMSEPVEASRSAGVLLAALNGLARTQDHDFRPLTKRGLYRIEPDGVTLTAIPQILHFEVRPPELTPAPYADLADLVATALADPKVSRVLKLLGGSDDRWFSWYLIYELVLEEFGGSQAEREKRIVALGWASKDELRSFRATANWHETEHGRHAVPHQPSQTPPSEVMSTLEAQHLISTLVMHWIRHPRGTGHPTQRGA